MEINWNLVLAVCTILGGVSALWFFWDKISDWFGAKPAERSSAGGSAVRAEGTGEIDLVNAAGGEVRAGQGGLGGRGGDAIVFSDGVSVKIVNHGKILGGDAGPRN